MAQQQRGDDVQPDGDHPEQDGVVPEDLDSKLRQLAAEARDANLHEALGYTTWHAYAYDAFHCTPPDQTPSARIAQLEHRRQQWDDDTNHPGTDTHLLDTATDRRARGCPRGRPW